MIVPAFDRHPASYRDPAGFVFSRDGIVFRQVNTLYKNTFEYLHSNGCYDALTAKGFLLPHVTTSEKGVTPDAYVVIRPEQLDVVTYPYEWSFQMLKDAALLTLQTMQTALEHDMVLKDATPHNVQWHQGRMVFIDTLSFDRFSERPWIAYRQFCENFLGPLLLMHYQQQPLHPLHLAWPDGIPLEIVREMLPTRAKFNLHIYLHIFLHARYKTGKRDKTGPPAAFTKTKMTNLLRSLTALVEKCRLKERDSTWSNYYEDAGSRQDYLPQKKTLVGQWLDEFAGISTGADLGANEGEFAEMMARRGIKTVAADLDPYCIDRLYKKIRENNSTHLQPMVLDLANASPGNGLNYKERADFKSRINRDIILALALVHHIAIGRNIPLEEIAGMLKEFGSLLIIEFVPATDPLVIRMRAGKDHPFADYSEEHFEQAFLRYYTLINKSEIGDSGRILYLFKRR